MMEFIRNKEVIFWDFDGVLMDSMSVRDKGFEVVLRDYPPEQVSRLMDFHHRNGGLSRYVKFRYFFEDIRNESVSEEEVNEWAAKFSAIMKASLLDKELLIKESNRFVRDNHQRFRMHIVSGSDGKELNYLCSELGIAKWFSSIHGSPTPKTEWVGKLIAQEGYDPSKCILIGDSNNDYQAAMDNRIEFAGYNNSALISKGNYIHRFG